ncbi:cytochrome P450 [Auriscalpium vulgare]|uniref:Cytochrome P450 n=1 Tax=Auriscalpium vulgare TaxID=40419 RepID=A0ACB8S405_9AGAM|nr:cytochrome P450 [Auriscalpium vulgare]
MASGPPGVAVPLEHVLSSGSAPSLSRLVQALLAWAEQHPAVLFSLFLGLTVRTIVGYLDSPWRKVPGGPKGLPIVGNLSQLTNKAWLFDPDLRKKYGDVIYLSAFGQPMIFLNTQKAAADLLDRRAHIYSDRPRLIVASEISCGGFFLAFTRYGSLWRRMRRAAHESLTKTKVADYHEIQTKEAVLLASDILAKASARNDHFRRSAASMIMSVVYDLPTILSEDDVNLKNIDSHIERLAKSSAPGAHFVELMPWMKNIPSRFAKWKRANEEWYERDSAMFERLVNRVQADKEKGVDRPSISASLLDDQERNGLTERQRAWLAGTMYAAGSETTSSALQWWSLAMVAYPEAQRRAQEELDLVVGQGRLPTFADYPHLPYIRAMVKETLRWRPNLPLAIPHAATEDDWYEGMFIPKGTLCFGNVFQCNNDPDIYGEDFMQFNPARHLDASGNLAPSPVDTKDEGHVMYGFGRRICVGRHVANDSLFMDMALMLWAFKMEPAKNAAGEVVPLDVDSFVDSGLVSRPVSFDWTVSPRFPEAATILVEERARYL